jgi:hypothetical protein
MPPALGIFDLRERPQHMAAVAAGGSWSAMWAHMPRRSMCGTWIGKAAPDTLEQSTGGSLVPTVAAG